MAFTGEKNPLKGLFLGIYSQGEKARMDKKIPVVWLGDASRTHISVCVSVRPSVLFLETPTGL